MDDSSIAPRLQWRHINKLMQNTKGNNDFQ